MHPFTFWVINSKQGKRIKHLREYNRAEGREGGDKSAKRKRDQARPGQQRERESDPDRGGKLKDSVSSLC